MPAEVSLATRPTTGNRSKSKGSGSTILRISGDFTFASDRQTVWDLLHDPDTIASCITGCESLDEIEPGRFRADIVVGIAAVKGRYSGTVEISEKSEPDSYRMTITGQGKPGKIDAFGVISLTDDQSITTLR